MVQTMIQTTGEGLFGWAVEVDDVEPVARRLDCAITTVTRQGLSARIAGIAEALREPLLPFFISRDHGVPDPGSGAGAGAGAGGITWIEVAGDAGRLHDWLGGADLAVRVVAGAPALRAVGIGEREFRP